MNKFSNSAFSRFFLYFPKLLLAGLLFSVPLAFFTGIFVLISYLTGFNNVIVWGLGIIPSMPFLSGLITVIRKLAVEKRDIKITNTFFAAVKDNFAKMLINGITAYLITACSFFAILYYYTLSVDDAVFRSVLTLYLIFTLLLIVMMYYVPIMTVTYELKLKDIYKNSFLLVFGKILRNLIATLFVAVIATGALLLITFSKGIWFGISVGFVTALLPMISVYIIISIISKGLQETVGEFVIPEKKHISEEELAYEKTAVENDNSESDYVFVNGRMIKKNKDKN